MKKISKNKKLPKYNLGRISSYGPVGSKPWENVMQSTSLDKLSQPISNMLSTASSSATGLNAIGGVGNAIGSAVNFTGSLINTFSDPTLTGTNKTYTTSGPISYTKTDYVNNEDEYKALKSQNTSNALSTVGSGAATGAAIGSIIPGVGTAIGGVVGAIGGGIASIFGASKRKRELKKKITEENKNITRKNTFNLADAHSDILSENYYSEYEDTQDDILYNEGKTPFEGKDKANALVGKGETIVDGITGDMTEVKSGSAVGTDDVPAVIKDEDAIAGNKRNPRTGNTFAEDMKPLTRMESKLKRNNERNIKSIAANTEKLVKAYTQPLANQLIAEQAAVLNKTSKKAKYANGKNFYDTVNKAYSYTQPILNTIGSLMPSIWNTIQGSQSPDTVTAGELYSKNPYASTALTKMAKRRYNVKPELNAINSLERRQRYNARQLGSEGGINRALDLAGALGLANQISNVYAKKQNVDNDYIAQEANMAAQLGAQEAANKSAAMKTAYDINAKNKATKKAYQYAALTGFANYAQQQQLNANRKRMDDARLRVLEKYYGLGTTADNINYLLGPLN